MAHLKVALLFGLVLTASLASAAKKADSEVSDDDYVDEERAHIVVRKFVKEEHLVLGRNLTVQIELYNAGNT